MKHCPAYLQQKRKSFDWKVLKKSRIKKLFSYSQPQHISTFFGFLSLVFLPFYSE